VFAESPEVLFVSIHQWPLYPGTGAMSDVGRGPGKGFTVNLPVPPGSGDETFVSHVQHLALPLAREYRPGLVLVSAGYDAHRDDPLADCEVTDEGYAEMAALVHVLGEELGVPVGAALEGGYELGALARSVAGTVGALAAPPGASPAGVPVHPATADARARLAAYWPGLGGAAAA
jgi:acetoin utilization deacetylase AcuC-like enzyme